MGIFGFGACLLTFPATLGSDLMLVRQRGINPLCFIRWKLLFLQGCWSSVRVEIHGLITSTLHAGIRQWVRTRIAQMCIHRGIQTMGQTTRVQRLF